MNRIVRVKTITRRPRRHQFSSEEDILSKSATCPQRWNLARMMLHLARKRNHMDYSNCVESYFHCVPLTERKVSAKCTSWYQLWGKRNIYKYLYVVYQIDRKSYRAWCDDMFWREITNLLWVVWPQKCCSILSGETPTIFCAHTVNLTHFMFSCCILLLPVLLMLLFLYNLYSWTCYWIICVHTTLHNSKQEHLLWCNKGCCTGMNILFVMC